MLKVVLKFTTLSLFVASVSEVVSFSLASPNWRLSADLNIISLERAVECKAARASLRHATDKSSTCLSLKTEEE